MLFLKNRDPAKSASEDWSIVQALFLVGKHWREQKEQTPSQVFQPLRVVLSGSMGDALLTRVKQLQTDPALKTLADQRGLMKNGTFSYLQWDPEKKEYAPAMQDLLFWASPCLPGPLARLPVALSLFPRLLC